MVTKTTILILHGTYRAFFETFVTFATFVVCPARLLSQHIDAEDDIPLQHRVNHIHA